MERIPQEGSEKAGCGQHRGSPGRAATLGAGEERLLKMESGVHMLRTRQRTFLEGDGAVQRKDLGGAGRLGTTLREA